MQKETIEVLKLFGELEGTLEYIADEISSGELGGCFGRMVYREDYDKDDYDDESVWEEMEEYFDGKDEFEIIVEWYLTIN